MGLATVSRLLVPPSCTIIYLFIYLFLRGSDFLFRVLWRYILYMKVCFVWPRTVQKTQKTQVSMRTNNKNEDRRNSGNTGVSVSNSPIQNFFSGSCVLVTGATGFVGKALVEKLLRSCPDLRTIYLLIRPKRGLDVQTRQKELLKNPVSMTVLLWRCFH